MNEHPLFAPAIYNLVDEIEQFAATEKIALCVVNEHGDEQKITYKALLQQANQVANAFMNAQLKKGDRILIMLPRSVEAYTTYIGALKAGLTIIACSDQLRTRDVDYRIRHAEASAIVIHDRFLRNFEGSEAMKTIQQFIVGEESNHERYLSNLTNEASTIFENVKTKREDLAFISYTSGTTGTPKGAMHYHGWAYAHIRTTAKAWLNIHENNLVWGTAAPGWQKWIWTPFLAALGMGATAFVYTGKFEPERYLQLIEQYRIEVLCCTPTEYRMMMKQETFGTYEYTYLKSVVSAGEPLNREVIERFFERYQLYIRDGYGQTENTLLIGTLSDEPLKIGSMGKPTPGNHVEIIDGFGEVIAPNQVGDIAVHIETPALFRGYYREPERTAMQFRGDWYVTGDRAYKDEDGYFWFSGRADDMIISAGYTIGPFDIEEALLKHPLVQECAVVASPDEERGSVVKAFIVLKDWSLTKQEGMKEQLQNFVKATIAPYSYPRKIEFLEELPKTMSGKIRRYELRMREQAK